MDNKKSSKKKKDHDRNDYEEPLKKTSCVNYDNIVDRQMGDKRFERERSHKLTIQEKGIANVLKEPQQAMSSTFDAFQRMAAGLEGRTIADKISDPNRPTWEQYKKDNEDKLDLVGDEVRKMVEYRAQLDRERDDRLRRGTNHIKKTKTNSSSSDDDSDYDTNDNNSDNNSDDTSNSSKHKHKKNKDNKKKHKKHKDDKKKKKKRYHDDKDDEHKHIKNKKHKSNTDDTTTNSMRLSDFMKSSNDDN